MQDEPIDKARAAACALCGGKGPSACLLCVLAFCLLKLRVELRRIATCRSSIILGKTMMGFRPCLCSFSFCYVHSCICSRGRGETSSKGEEREEKKSPKVLLDDGGWWWCHPLNAGWAVYSYYPFLPFHYLTTWCFFLHSFIPPPPPSSDKQSHSWECLFAWWWYDDKWVSAPTHTMPSSFTTSNSSYTCFIHVSIYMYI